MLSCQPKEAGWSSVPEHLIASIVQLAFADTDRTPSQWLRWALVCRHVHRSLHALHKFAVLRAVMKPLAEHLNHRTRVASLPK